MTKAAQGGWPEERWASRRHLHRRDWRCVDRLAIARDSDRRTCCVAEANAGGQRSGEEGGGRVGERARVVAEHGAVVAGGDCCIASVGGCREEEVVGAVLLLLLLGTRRRNRQLWRRRRGGRSGGWCIVQGWSAMPCNVEGISTVQDGCSVSRSIFGLTGGRSATCDDVVLTDCCTACARFQLKSCHERSPNRSRLHPKAQTLLPPRRSQDPQSKHNLPRDNACLDTRSLFSLTEEATSTSPVRFLCI